jgi:hypothetical protein
MLQVVVSPTIVILMTLQVSFMLLANVYSRGVTHDNHHVIVKYLWYRPQYLPDFQFYCLMNFEHSIPGNGRAPLIIELREKKAPIQIPCPTFQTLTQFMVLTYDRSSTNSNGVC